MDIEYPESYLCPITLDLMIEPVKASDDNIYERKAIIDWYKTNKTSPLTREKLFPEFIIQNNLKAEIQSFKKNFGIKNEENSIKFNCINCQNILLISIDKKSIICNTCKKNYVLVKCKDCQNNHVIYFKRSSNFRCTRCGSINILKNLK